MRRRRRPGNVRILSPAVRLKQQALINPMFLLDTRSVNIPWSHEGMGDADYIYAFQRIVMPIANEFNPDFVIGALISLVGCRPTRTALAEGAGPCCDGRLQCLRDTMLPKEMP